LSGYLSNARPPLITLRKMIPRNITKEHILKAVEEVKRKGVPAKHSAKKFGLLVDDDAYPPKYVVSLANKYANGRCLGSTLFNGGQETNSFLKKFGFKVVEMKRIGKSSTRGIRRIAKQTSTRRKPHNERCQDCKRAVAALLKKIYGDVRLNHKFTLGVLPKHFVGNDSYGHLGKIFSRLQEWRGHRDFVRTNNLPNVDYYVPTPGFVVEFDESQHFTECRMQTLQAYPKELQPGFDTKKWIDLCRKIHAKDNDPAYRDEQRAWYDTLRDFLPVLKDLQPTVRLYAGDMQWCGLNPDSEFDLKRFKTLVERNTVTPGGIEVYEDRDPLLARIVIADDWIGRVDQARRVLKKVCKSWHKGRRVRCLITCGAFLTFDWPDHLVAVAGPKSPRLRLEELIEPAEKECRRLLDVKLRRKLMQFTDYVTIGVDSYKTKISLSTAQIRHPHVELVAVIDLRRERYFWTGKSYPTSGQQKGLIRVEDLSGHFMELDFGKVMVLGCHDLNVFSLRGKKTTKTQWRKTIREKFYDIAKRESPSIVLHHPHTTDSDKIWRSAWNELHRTLPAVTNYLGAGRYWHGGGEQRSDLRDVLAKTKLGSSVDFVVHNPDSI